MRAAVAGVAIAAVLILWGSPEASAAEPKGLGLKSTEVRPGEWLGQAGSQDAKAGAVCPANFCTGQDGTVSIDSQTVVAYVEANIGNTEDCRWDVTVDFGDGASGYYEYGFIRTGDAVYFGLLPSPLQHTYAEPGTYYASISVYNGESDSGNWICPDGSLPLTVQYGEASCDGITHGEVLPLDDSPPILSSFPNDDAGCDAVWIPGLENGFVAQGLGVMVDDTTYLSGYIHPPEDPKDDKSGEHCAIAHVSLTTGEVLDSYDFDRSTCKHGGGIAIDSDLRVWIADTRKLLLVTGPMFTNPDPAAAKIDKDDFEKGGLKASFLVDGRPGHLWVGSWIQDGPAGKIYEFTTDYLEERATVGGPIKKSAATDARSIPLDTQGAAFNGGALFAASSNSKTGFLKTDHGTFGFGPGVEEIQFAGECLWAVFEAGARIYQKKSFPVIARFDPGLIPNPFDPHPECAAS